MFVVPTVVEMVDNYLAVNGYDGLVEEFGECACLLGSLAPCGAINESCCAGHRVGVPLGSCDEHGSQCTWHIVPGLKPQGGEKE